MSILFLTGDIMFPAQVAGVARRLNAQLQTISSDVLLLEQATAHPGAVVILDLSSSLVDVATIVPRLKALPTPPKTIIAFGPHVHAAQLSAAQTAGCDVVLTRGQFSSQMVEVLSRCMTVESPGT